MNRLTGLLARLSQERISLAVEGGYLAVSPAAKLTPEIREAILRHRPDLMALARLHGPRLLDLFHDPPAWPQLRGRSGLLGDPDEVLRAVGRRVSLRDGREAILRAVLYETRTGRTRCRVDVASGETLVLDPEDVFQPSAAVAERGESA